MPTYDVQLVSPPSSPADPPGTGWLGEKLGGGYTCDEPVEPDALIQVGGISYVVVRVEPDPPTLIVKPIYPDESG
ncbi:MAG: hypothetical protein ACXVQ3_05435 [Gaiellaceae bacterium]